MLGLEIPTFTPKLNCYRKKGTLDPFSEVTNEEKQTKILKTIIATERYLLLSCIATGILQLLRLKYEGKINVSKFRYLCTLFKLILSEASMMAYLRKNFFRFIEKKKEISIIKIISSKQIPLENEEVDLFLRCSNF